MVLKLRKLDSDLRFIGRDDRTVVEDRKAGVEGAPRRTCPEPDFRGTVAIGSAEG